MKKINVNEEIVVFRINKILYDMKERNCYNYRSVLNKNTRKSPCNPKIRKFIEIQTNIDNLREEINRFLLATKDRGLVTKFRISEINVNRFLGHMEMLAAHFNKLENSDLKEDLRYFLREIVILKQKEIAVIK